jgi:hypothetical protein
MTLPLILLVLFLVCGLIYARASKELQRLDKLRLQNDPPPNPDNMLGSATEFARKMGVTLAPGGEELKKYCERNGHGDAYNRANRRLYGAILIALMCAYFIIKMSPAKT